MIGSDAVHDVGHENLVAAAAERLQKRFTAK
jgi:hypothetical protein